MRTPNNSPKVIGQNTWISDGSWTRTGETYYYYCSLLEYNYINNNVHPIITDITCEHK